jgi:predicted ester cyclase
MIAALHVMSVAENIEIVRRWVTRGMGGEASLADQLIAPEYISHDAGPDDPPGPQVQRATIRNMHKAFSPMRFVIDDIFADGDRVVVRDHMIGVNTGPFFGKPPTHKSIDVERITIYRVEGGKLRESWTAMNTYALLQQLGLR